MSQTFGSNLTPEEIEETMEATALPTTTTYEPADSYLAAEARAFEDTSTSAGDFGGSSIRQSLRDDVSMGRQWASERAGRVSDVIREEPMKATVYALVGGVFLGMLLRR